MESQICNHYNQTMLQARFKLKSPSLVSLLIVSKQLLDLIASIYSFDWLFMDANITCIIICIKNYKIIFIFLNDLV